MAEGDIIPYRFKNGQWEELGDDGETWTTVDAELAALLAPYTKVTVNPDGSMTFANADGSRTTTSGQINAALSPGEPSGPPPLPGAPIDPALFQAGFPIGVAQRGNVQAGQTTPPFWNQDIEAIFGVYPPRDEDGEVDSERVVQARAYAEQLGISGASAPVAPKTPKTAYPGRVIRGEDIGGPPGSLFLQDPSGNLTPYTPPTPFTDAMSPRDAAKLVADAVREVGSGGGGGITPEEAEQWIKALTSSSAQGAPSLGAAPTTTPPEPTGFAAMLGGGGSTPPVSSIFADAAKVASFQGLTPEQYDPNYETASPEAQAAIRADLASKQMGVGASSQAASSTTPVAAGQTGADVSQSPNFLDALKKREKQLAGVGPGGKPLLTGGQGETDTFNAAMGGFSLPGPAGQLPSAGGGAFPAGSAQNIGDVLKQAQGGDLAGARQNAQGLVAQGFAARAGAGGAPPGAGPSAPPMTFEQALFQINERVRQERQKQKSLRDTGRTVFL